MSNMPGSYKKISYPQEDYLEVNLMNQFMIETVYEKIMSYNTLDCAKQVVSGLNYMISSILQFPNGKYEYVIFIVYNKFGNLNLTNFLVCDGKPNFEEYMSGNKKIPYYP